jgi:hypothetical protein
MIYVSVDYSNDSNEFSNVHLERSALRPTSVYMGCNERVLKPIQSAKGKLGKKNSGGKKKTKVKPCTRKQSKKNYYHHLVINKEFG